jgi:hypothetical protein
LDHDAKAAAQASNGTLSEGIETSGQLKLREWSRLL